MPGTSSHEPRPFRRAPRIAAVVAWCALIFLASHQPDLRVADDDLLDLVLRKAAHVAVFGVLAILVLRAIRTTVRPGTGRLVAAWAATVAYAASDEFHQSFVAGRAGQPSDVAIDAVGATIALLAVSARTTRTDRPTEPAS